MADQTLVAGDRTTLRWTLIDSETRAAINVTGHNVQLRYSIAQSAVEEREMTIIDGPTGVVAYQFEADELTPGEMRVEVVITDAEGKEFSSEEMARYRIRARLAA